MDKKKQKDLEPELFSSIKLLPNNNIVSNPNDLAERPKEDSESSKKTPRKEMEFFLESTTNLNEKSPKTEVKIFPIAKKEKN